jgi:UPF0176 protein
MRILNVAFYHFSPIAEPAVLREKLRAELSGSPLRGTLILAAEGVNGMWAGPEGEVRRALGLLCAEPGFAGLKWKESFSEKIPFAQLVFKLKPEIVTFRIPEVSPPPPAGRISPAELLGWYESGKDFLVLDTRNEFEFKLGKFAQAESLQLKQFVEFASAARELPEEWKRKPIVTYCTGGIRCEKAAPYLNTLGFAEVYQLDGGILNYFEKVGGRHWEGECFVFDQRVALDPELKPTGAELCEFCQGPIPRRDEACPHCGRART